MYLKEPRKKKRTNVQSKSPFPINFDDKNNWTIYTAYLGVSGTCIVDPQEMTAIYSMGFFGKGTLSRSLPNFGKSLYGVPPLVRDRQWQRRRQWLKDTNSLHLQTTPLAIEEHNSDSIDQNEEVLLLNSESHKNHEEEIILDEPMEIHDRLDENRDAIAVQHEKMPEDSGKTTIETSKIDEVILDSTEEDEICEIIDKTDAKDDEVGVFNNRNINLPLQPDEYLDRALRENEDKKEMNSHEILVLPDSDSDTENYLKNIKPRIETEGFPLIETLQLTFEETFFLMYGLGCLQLINYDGKLLSIADAWDHFNSQDKFFLPRYIIYHYFRSKGWIVKPGLKYGCDFLLYKQGPPFYHASYIVTVETVDGLSLVRDEIRSTRKLTWNSLLHTNRLSEITAKEFLIAQVLWPSTISSQSNPVPLEALSEFTVRELLWRRWKPTGTDELVTLNEDEDSDDEDSL